MKLLHFADTHLGMENYGRVNAQTGLHSRFEDGLKCLSFIVDTALRRLPRSRHRERLVMSKCWPTPSCIMTRNRFLRLRHVQCAGHNPYSGLGVGSTKVAVEGTQ